MDILVLGNFPVSISAGYSLRREDDHPTEGALLAKVGVMPKFYEKTSASSLKSDFGGPAGSWAPSGIIWT